MIQLNNQPHSEFYVPGALNDGSNTDIAVRLIAAQDAERSRVAREIHDDLGQKVLLMSLELWQLGEKLKGPETLRRHFRNLQHQIDEISTDVHRMAHKLHPATLDHVGLVAAIKSLCREISASGKLRVQFSHHGSLAKLSKDVNLCVFRIAQETLRNCIKHSNAETARVMLTNTGNEIRFTVTDEGRGFDMNRKTMERGLGFTSMRERLRVVGGTMSIDSSPSKGTQIEASIPLEGEK
ncbi:MAG: sensor histidine kinase [Pyrinomonadaceae bacterium]